MPTTSNFGWTTPADTDYVKDGANAIRTLANGIDTSLVDLKGGTTGQILAKTSNTNLDFEWINNDQGDITNVGVSSPITGGGSSGSVTIGIQDATTAQKGAVQLTDSTSSTSTTTAATPNSVKSAYDLANGAIAKSLVDAKGDLIVASADNTVGRLPIGTNGHTLVADSAETLGVKWAAASSGGGMTSIASGTLSGASVTISSISGSYTDLRLIIKNFKPATDNAYLKAQLNGTTSSSYYTTVGMDTNRSNQTFNSDFLYIAPFNDNSVAQGLSQTTFYEYANTSTWKMCEGICIGNHNTTTTNLNAFYQNGFFNSTSAITSITLFPDTGNFTSGDYILYGMK